MFAIQTNCGCVLLPPSNVQVEQTDLLKFRFIYLQIPQSNDEDNDWFILIKTGVWIRQSNM